MLRQDQIKLLGTLHLDGMSIKDISIRLHTTEDIVKGFMPTGELAVACEKVIESKNSLVSAESECKAMKAKVRMIKRSVSRYNIALDNLSDSIEGLIDQVDKMENQKDIITAELDNMDYVSSVVDANDAERNLTVALLGHEKALAYKAEQDEVEANNARERAEIASRKAKAEKFAIEVITSAAVESAKSAVAEIMEKNNV